MGGATTSEKEPEETPTHRQVKPSGGKDARRTSVAALCELLLVESGKRAQHMTSRGGRGGNRLFSGSPLSAYETPCSEETTLKMIPPPWGLVQTGSGFLRFGAKKGKLAALERKWKKRGTKP